MVFGKKVHIKNIHLEDHFREPFNFEGPRTLATDMEFTMPDSTRKKIYIVPTHCKMGEGADDGALSGFAASPGLVEGPARVIFSADQIGDIEDGEILVAPLTAPSWAPVFGKIRATVTDVGGMMCHAAIVCREYGLPAVTGTAFGTKNIKTWQLIRVDGNTGKVTVLG
jgi:phosphoenolpyruvate synthase/pyruvate phosphate dikinase